MQVALPSGNRRNGVTQPMCAEVGAGKQRKTTNPTVLVRVWQLQELGPAGLHLEQGAGETRLVCMAKDPGHTIRGVQLGIQ